MPADKDSNSKKYSVIRQAIIDKQSLHCWYDGLERVFSPHMLGYRGNTMVALVYQFDGESWSSGVEHTPQAKNWRNFNLVQVEELEVLTGPDGKKSKEWFTHPSYNGTSNGWTSVAVKLEVPA